MPADKETKTIDIPFSVGLDQSDDPQGQPKGLSAISNVRWEKETVCQTRGAFVFDKDISGTAMSFVRSGNELGVVTGAAGIVSVSREGEIGRAHV